MSLFLITGRKSNIITICKPETMHSELRWVRVNAEDISIGLLADCPISSDSHFSVVSYFTAGNAADILSLHPRSARDRSA